MIETSWLNYQILLGIILGAGGLLLTYIIKSVLSDDNNDDDKEYNSKDTVKASKKHQEKHRKTNKKKVPECNSGPGSRWNSKKTNKSHSFSHPWLLTTLKGHTGTILDLDYSNNDKFLATCADEDPDPGGHKMSHASTQLVIEKENTSSSSSFTSSTSSSSSSSSSSSAEPSPASNNKGLSRRQRKNRRREDPSPSDVNNNSNTNGNNNNNKNKQKRKEAKVQQQIPSRQFMRLNIPERKLCALLNSYVLSYEQMCAFGYPIESSIYPGRAVIYKNCDVKPDESSHLTRFDVNAEEFIPQTKNSCKGNSSCKGKNSCSSSAASSSSDDSTESDESASVGSDQDNSLHFFPQQQQREKCPLKDTTNLSAAKQHEWRRNGGEIAERKCSRCGAGFFIARGNNEYLTQESCTYHWGKLRRTSSSGIAYTCCNGSKGSYGCSRGKVHVWAGLVAGVNGPYDSYVRTKARRTRPTDGHYGVYALDCEMCFTAAGLELTKVTVVGSDGRLVYNSYVRPDNEVVDYNTRFSGITAKDLICRKGGSNNNNNANCTTSVKSLKEVQNDLMGFINASTILVGHGLENDLRALKIMHYNCVDTAATFPHYNGWPFRRSLKTLALHILKREIQRGSGSKGHDSYEDASTAMEIMLWRVRKDFRSLLGNDYLFICDDFN